MKDATLGFTGWILVLWALGGFDPMVIVYSPVALAVYLLFSQPERR